MFDYKDLSEEHLSQHIDHIIDITRSIPMHKVTILTGGNSLGKSLIRKQLPFHVSEQMDCKPEKCVSSVSMQLRTESNAGWGALSGCMHDMPWSSTSESTIQLIKGLLGNSKGETVKDRFIVIDEMEIGMGKEVQMGTCLMLNEMLPQLLENNYGVLVITHSDTVVNTLNHDNFINIENMTEQEWLNREITPVSPDEITTWATALFREVQKRSNKKK